MGALSFTTSQVDQAVSTGLMTTYPCQNGAQFRDAISAINAGSTIGVVELKNGTTYTINLPLNINVAKTIIRMNGATIDASGIGNNALFVLDHTGGSSTGRQRQFSIEDGVLIGPTGSTSSTAIYVNGTQASRSPRIVVKNVSIEGFGYAIDLNNYAQVCQFIAVDIVGSNVGVRQQAGTSSGRAVSFHGGSFSNTTTAIQQSNTNGELSFYGTSFDYNGKLLVTTGGMNCFYSCHIEGDNTDWVQDCVDLNTDGTSAIFYNGKMVCTGSAPTSQNYLFNLRNATCKVVLQDVMLSNLVTANQQLSTGSGKLYVRNSHNLSAGVIGLNATVSDQLHSNSLFDGGFEQTNVVDYWSITNDDGVVPTTRLTGTLGTVSTSTAQFRSGSRSLLIDKTSSGTFQVTCLIPSTEGNKLGGRYWHYTPSSGGLGGNSVAVSTGFAVVAGNDGNGVPMVTFNELSSSNITPSAAWSQAYVKHNTPSPAWATHYYVRWSITGSTVGDLHLDDCYFNTY